MDGRTWSEKDNKKNKHCYKRWEVVDIHVRLKRNDE